MFFQGVRLEAVRRRVKVVASNTTDETLCLEGDGTVEKKNTLLLCNWKGNSDVVKSP